jgi:translation initiation factor 1 (eIF-1/SUI1)
MDQTIIAGIGNIYADESLCRSSIDPRSIVNKIPEDKMKDLYKAIDLKTTAKALKEGLACGGTVKDGVIELQGDHKRNVRQILVKLGFSDESIED